MQLTCSTTPNMLYTKPPYSQISPARTRRDIESIHPDRDANATLMHMSMLRSRTLIRKRLLQPTPHLAIQSTIIIFHISPVPLALQFLQLLRQRISLRAPAIYINEHHNGKRHADKDSEEPESLMSCQSENTCHENREV